MITIDIFKQLAKRIPFGKTETDKSNKLYIEQGVYELTTDGNNNGSFWLDKPTTIYDLKLNDTEIPAAIIQVSAHKNIVKTPLAGQGQAVIEIVGFEIYQISVAGLVIDENGFPHYQIADLEKKLFKINEALAVECEFLRMFDIHYIVIEDYSFPPIEGLENAMAFEFVAYSDQPIELELKNGLLPIL